MSWWRLAHACWCRRCVARTAQVIGVLAVLAVALIWAYAGDHLLKALVQDQQGGAGVVGVAGVDAKLLCGALAAAYIASRLRTS